MPIDEPLDSPLDDDGSSSAPPPIPFVQSSVFLRAGDTIEPLTVTLVDGLGVVIDLTAASSVTFQMKLPGAPTFKVSAFADVVDAPNGQVFYAWNAGDTDTPGRYFASWRIDWGGGLLQTVPAHRQFPITIAPA